MEPKDTSAVADQAEGVPVLKQAWQRFATYDSNAGAHQTLFKWLQLFILLLGVFVVLLVLIQTQFFGVDPPDPDAPDPDGTYSQRNFWYQLLRSVIIAAPILISILIAATNRFKSGAKWIRLRAAAESLKREIYRYRGRSGIYSDEATTETSREIKLDEKIESIKNHLMKTVDNEAAVKPYEGKIPPERYGAADEDDGFSVLTAEKYLDIRLGDQLKYFARKTSTLEKKLKRLQWGIYISGGLGTLLAAVGFELWVAVTTSIAAAFVTYLEYNQTENALVLYNQVITKLNNTLTWWSGLTAAHRARPTNQDLLIEQTEQALADEHAAWVQQMTDALSELQLHQEATVKRVKAEIADVREKGADVGAALAAERAARAAAIEEAAAAEPKESDEPAEGSSADEEAPTATPEIAPPTPTLPTPPPTPPPATVSKTLTEADFIEVADDLGIELAAMKAVAEVEAGGSGFKGDKPKILFEGHIFWRQLKKHGIDPTPHVAGNENVLHRKWTRDYYREDQYARLEKAKMVNENAALESASWGMFQIMGFHWESLGYASAKAFVDLMYKSEGEHLKAFAKFMKVNKLVRYLKNLNWAKFARGYNGPGYAANKYDIKMADAYKKHKG